MKNFFENIPGVVSICGLYAKTQEALDTLLTKLESIGYKVDNLRNSEHRQRDGVSVEKMEKNGWSLWFASLDVRRGKCGSCNGIISTQGIQSHGHKCELCGAVTYYHILNAGESETGSNIRFSFINRDENIGMADIKMKAHHWDTDEGYLYLYPEVMDGLWLHGDRAQAYLDGNKDKWDWVTLGDGRQLIRVKYPHPWNYNESAINPSEIYGHHWNHKIVKIWDGKEYDEWSQDFPVPETISIYEAWHWAPLQPSPHLHENIISAAGMVSDCGYYYQDGRTAFYDVHIKRMRTFVEHFTVLDLKEWDSMIARSDKSGPGMIKAIARFCHKNAEVENRPNIGNVLVGFSKAIGGQKLTSEENDAMVDGLKDIEVAKTFFDIFKRT